MKLIGIATALVLSPLLMPTAAAEDVAPAASDGAAAVDKAEPVEVKPVSVEERLAALEKEVAALREQLNTETLAKALAEQMVIAQRKAMEPPSPEDAVATFAKEHDIDAEKQAVITTLVQTQRQERDALLAKMRSGDIPRDEIRDQYRSMKEKHEKEMGEHLSPEQIEALGKAQRPPMMRSMRGMGGMGGMGQWGGRKSRRGGGGKGGDRGGASEAPAGQAEF